MAPFPRVRPEPFAPAGPAPLAVASELLAVPVAVLAVSPVLSLLKETLLVAELPSVGACFNDGAVPSELSEDVLPPPLGALGLPPLEEPPPIELTGPAAGPWALPA
ncbi:hypothetical protein PAB09_02105 [Corynebacterium sp. SCR221107]|uniref:hypothetical protein n=1 Tax=Corynebacterium sp. SCR221107 TaxID=3017361 RepID=UPI0022EC1B36|nr:hypothetical protein [Corynebacterium sp. SCR221107]WBT09154.1 hypothetical protein PAB09_02105 [Corynebacterium sp. SCR221107]